MSVSIFFLLSLLPRVRTCAHSHAASFPVPIQTSCHSSFPSPAAQPALSSCVHFNVSPKLRPSMSPLCHCTSISQPSLSSSPRLNPFHKLISRASICLPTNAQSNCHVRCTRPIKAHAETFPREPSRLWGSDDRAAGGHDHRCLLSSRRRLSNGRRNSQRVCCGKSSCTLE